MDDGRDDLKGMDTAGDDDPRAASVRRYLRAPRQDVVDDRVGTIDDDRDSAPDQSRSQNRFDRIAGESRLTDRVEHRRDDSSAIAHDISGNSDHVIGCEFLDQPRDERRLADPAGADDHDPTCPTDMAERCGQDLVNLWI